MRFVSSACHRRDAPAGPRPKVAGFTLGLEDCRPVLARARPFVICPVQAAPIQQGAGPNAGIGNRTPQGVPLAGLPGSGCRCAVFLIHTEVSRRAAENRGFPPGAISNIGCYHSRSVNVV